MEICPPLPSWLALGDATSDLSIRADAVEQSTPENLRLLALEGAERQMGRLRLQPSTAEFPAKDVIFDKPLKDLRAEDVRWLLEQGVQFSIHGNQLLVDFQILVGHYRQNPLFQRY